MSRHRPPEADSRISRFTARLLWAEASLGAPLGRGFLLMQCVTGSAGWRLGGGSRQPSRPNQVFKKRAVVRYAAINTLKSSPVRHCRASRV